MNEHRINRILGLIDAYTARQISCFGLLAEIESIPLVKPASDFKVVVGTTEGDAHFFGSALTVGLLKVAGIEVTYVPQADVETFFEKIASVDPDLIVMTCLLKSSIPNLNALVRKCVDHNICCPLLMGGAALTPQRLQIDFAPYYQGPIYYCKNAVFCVKNCLEYALARPLSISVISPKHPDPVASASDIQVKSSLVKSVVPPEVPSYDTVIESDFDLKYLFAWINPRSLYTLHLGVRGNIVKLLAEKDPKIESIVDKVESAKALICQNPDWCVPKVIRRWFKCQSDGNRVNVFEIDGVTPLTQFYFPRQPLADGLCLADYIASDQTDVIGLMVASIGGTISAELEALLNQGRLSDMLVLNALAVQCAEALAEKTHFEMRQEVSKTPEPLNLEAIFKEAYTSRRYSPGYSACPDLSDQEKIFDLLKPQQIGVSLTDTHMMVPESSVSALVFHHPQAEYF